MEIESEQVWLALHKALSSNLEAMRHIGNVLDGDVSRLLTFDMRELENVAGQLANKVHVAISNFDSVMEVWLELKKNEVQIISFTDGRYPSALLAVKGFPPLVYAKGNLSLLGEVSIGICGSRSAREDSLKFASGFGLFATEMDVAVTSGYAKGIDTAAHLSALNSGGNTIIVLAEGILHFRVKREFRNISNFLERSLVISQFYPDHIWQSYRAMERNKVICGVSKALLVVEASEKGGTIAAGRECLRQEKSVLVVERSDPRKTAAGNQLLINEGGTPLQSIEELEAVLSRISSDLEPAHSLVRNSRECQLPEQLRMIDMGQ